MTRFACAAVFLIGIILPARGVSPVELAQQAYLKSSQTRNFQEFGVSVAVSGNTVVVGAPHDRNPRAPFDQESALEGAAYVFVREGANWIEQARLKVFDADQSHFRGVDFGRAVAISGDTIVVGAPMEFQSGAESQFEYGAVYVFKRTGTAWTQEARLQAFNPDKGDRFGASVGISGDTLVVGAPGESSDATGVDGDGENNDVPAAGAAYVFYRTGTSWNRQAFLKPWNPGEGFVFGGAVAVSGNTVVVGSREETNDDIDGYGAAYVFMRNGVTWIDQGYLKPIYEIDTQFGNTVAVDGNTVAVGCYSGGAYVFVPDGADWKLQGRLIDSLSSSEDLFGASLAISGDVVVVGAPGEASNGTGVNPQAQFDNTMPEAGAAYVFQRAGTSWSQIAYLKASNTEAADEFGLGVGVSGDIIAIGAPREDSAAFQVNGDQIGNGEPQAGAAYIFSPDAGEPAGLTIETSPMHFPVSDENVLLAPTAKFEAPSFVDWENGTLVVEITPTGLPEDQLSVRSIIGGIRVDGSVIKYEGVAFARLASSGNGRLEIVFNAAASRLRIQALIQKIQYANGIYVQNLTDNGRGSFPDRTVTFRLRDTAGELGSASRVVRFPYLTGLESSPDMAVMNRTDVASVDRFEIMVSGVFSNGERRPLTANRVEVGYCDEILTRFSPDQFKFNAREVGILGGICAVQFSLDEFTTITTVYVKSRCFIILFTGQVGDGQPTALLDLKNKASAAPESISPGRFYALQSLMNETPEGRRLTALYWQHTPELVQIALGNSALRAAALQTLQNFIPALDALLNGKGGDVAITQAMIDQLNSTWTSLASAGSPALKGDMDSERNRLNGFANFVGKNFSEWAGMLQVPAPAQPYVSAMSGVKVEGRFTVESTYLPDVNYSLWKNSQVSGGVWQPVADVIVKIDPLGVFLTDPNAAGPAFYYKVGAQAPVP